MDSFFIVSAGVFVGKLLSDLALAAFVMVRARRAQAKYMEQMKAGSPEFQAQLDEAAAIVRKRQMHGEPTEG